MFEIKEKEAQKQMEKLKSEAKGAKDGGALSQAAAQQPPKPCYLLQVPTHLLPFIFTFMPVRNVFLTCVTCKHMQEGSNDADFWKLRSVSAQTPFSSLVLHPDSKKWRHDLRQLVQDME
jgi:hypothetical protein